ncbi:L-threo-3-deoxy-hexylosonate aldolase-like protein 1 [Elsinoe australis]|uniref:L-threo-3-deoxy-hexylosonate aldolase-like protein 1 n=1 Tax=Elsinoe australis TaxID=40998 RepID=A0A4U7B746_9PEZI|nr:L-threo-3-deoxy-hexylosonate aldolase-like protein 1 [Elsinoe australis]
MSVLKPGVYAPVPSPFTQDGKEDLALPPFEYQVKRLVDAGAGIVVAGTLGEAGMLSRDERTTLIRTARGIIDAAGAEKAVPLIAGAGGGSVRESVQLAEEAAEAGADAVIVVAPAYYAFAYGKDKDAVKDFFTSIADRSRVPVMIYNIPFAAGGIDLDADMLIELSEHKNIVGVKLTCYNISKGHKVALHVNTAQYQQRHPLPFLVLPGSSDYLLPAIVGRQHGCIAGPVKLYPKVCAKIFRLSTQALVERDMAKLEEAQHLQDTVTDADSVINRVGFLGIKAALDIHVAPQSGLDFLGGACRKPLPEVSPTVKLAMRDGLKRVFELENAI